MKKADRHTSINIRVEAVEVGLGTITAVVECVSLLRDLVAVSSSGGAGVVAFAPPPLLLSNSSFILPSGKR